MINVRTVETSRVDDKSALARIVEGAYISELHGGGQYGMDTQVGYINLSELNVYIKEANGMIKTIPPAPIALLKRAAIHGDLDQLIIQTRRIMRIEDITANYKYMLEHIKPEDYDPEHDLVKKSYHHILQFQAKRRADAANAIPTVDAEIYRSLHVPRTIGGDQAWKPKSVKAQIDAGYYDDVATIDDDIRDGRVNVLANSYCLKLSALTKGNTTPIYVKEHNVLVAVGNSGIAKLRNIPHPQSAEHQARAAAFISQCYQDKVFTDGVAHYLEKSNYPDIGLRKETKRFMYSIEIVDNEGKYGSLWCHMFGQIVPIHPFSRESAKSGIYVTTTTIDEANPLRPIVGFTRYEKVEDIPNMKLYKSMQEAQSSPEFRAIAEYQYKQRDQEIKLMDQVERTRQAESAIEINNQKHQLDMNKLSLETKKAEGEAARLKFDAEKLQDELTKQRNEREKAERDAERARLAHERDLERARLEREALLLKHAAERAKFAADRDAEVRKAKADAYRAAQEREALKAKQKAESRSFMLKFISDSIKYVPGICKSCIAFVKKYMPVRPENIVNPT